MGRERRDQPAAPVKGWVRFPSFGEQPVPGNTGITAENSGVTGFCFGEAAKQGRTGAAREEEPPQGDKDEVGRPSPLGEPSLPARKPENSGLRGVCCRYLLLWAKAPPTAQFTGQFFPGSW